MIVRILGEGQRDLSREQVDSLNVYDHRIQAALDADDEEAFHAALGELLEQVRGLGRPVADGELVPSELILPSSDAHVGEVRAMLGEGGLIPG